jgi:2-polyprenyl-3-methyl-5-hydroxy-6-metoxy-1,4-benzoquinol methylase
VRRFAFDPRADAARCARILATYDDLVVRGYVRARFQIINPSILGQMARHLPVEGRVIDLGCGFGLFSAWFSLAAPGRSVLALDVDARRVAMARRSAALLGLADRVTYQVGDARCFPDDHSADCIVTLDLLHHLPAADAPALLARCHRALAPGGRLVVKDVETRPRAKLWFTWLLDRMMQPRGELAYRSRVEMTRLLEQAGFRVWSQPIRDWLPYPHILYVCDKR